jgi:hypothetical protein
MFDNPMSKGDFRQWAKDFQYYELPAGVTFDNHELQQILVEEGLLLNENTRRRREWLDNYVYRLMTRSWWRRLLNLPPKGNNS